MYDLLRLIRHRAACCSCCRLARAYFDHTNPRLRSSKTAKHETPASTLRGLCASQRRVGCTFQGKATVGWGTWELLLYEIAITSINQQSISFSLLCSNHSATVSPSTLRIQHGTMIPPQRMHLLSLRKRRWMLDPSPRLFDWAVAVASAGEERVRGHVKPIGSGNGWETNVPTQ